MFKIDCGGRENDDSPKWSLHYSRRNVFGCVSFKTKRSLGLTQPSGKITIHFCTSVLLKL